MSLPDVNSLLEVLGLGEGAGVDSELLDEGFGVECGDGDGLDED
jgi:hypothetical protein